MSNHTIIFVWYTYGVSDGDSKTFTIMSKKSIAMVFFGTFIVTLTKMYCVDTARLAMK